MAASAEKQTSTPALTTVSCWPVPVHKQRFEKQAQRRTHHTGLGAVLEPLSRRPSSAGKAGVSGRTVEPRFRVYWQSLAASITRISIETVREFRIPPALPSSAGFTATQADAPSLAHRTSALFAITVEMRVAAPDQGLQGRAQSSGSSATRSARDSVAESPPQP